MDKVYGIFSGAYSDWNVHGFFEDHVEAMKYCAKINKSEANYWNQCYVKTLDKIVADVRHVELQYQHEVVFDFDSNNKFTMRNTPDRFDYYIGEPKEKGLEYNIFKSQNGWVSIKLNSDSREHAEKISQDIIGKLSYKITELGKIKNALSECGFKFFKN